MDSQWRHDGSHSRDAKLRLYFAQVLVLVHVVLKGFAAINKHHRNFIIELPPKLVVGVDIYFLPSEAAPALELGGSP